MPNFSIFTLRVKKISLGQVKKYAGRRRVGLLFSAGQKKTRVGSGPISSQGPSLVFLHLYIWYNSIGTELNKLRPHLFNSYGRMDFFEGVEHASDVSTLQLIFIIFFFTKP